MEVLALRWALEPASKLMAAAVGAAVVDLALALAIETQSEVVVGVAALPAEAQTCVATAL